MSQVLFVPSAVLTKIVKQKRFTDTCRLTIGCDCFSRSSLVARHTSFSFSYDAAARPVFSSLIDMQVHKLAKTLF